jgi:hypothetical protein
MSTPLSLLDKAQRPVDSKMAKGGVGFDSCLDEFIKGITDSSGVELEDERFKVVEF